MTVFLLKLSVRARGMVYGKVELVLAVDKRRTRSGCDGMNASDLSDGTRRNEVGHILDAVLVLAYSRSMSVFFC